MPPTEPPELDETVEQPALTLRRSDMPAQLEVRDIARRELGLRIVPWETPVETNAGWEQFTRGAFDGIEPSAVKLRMEHEDPVAGRGIGIEQLDDAAYMTFKVSSTPRGDEILTLAADGVTDGASVGFYEVPGGTKVQTRRDGRVVRTHQKVNLVEVSTTWQPAYRDTGVVSIRSQSERKAEVPETTAPAAENQPASPAPVIDVGSLTTGLATAIEQLGDKLSERSNADVESIKTEFKGEIDGIKEDLRKQFSLPGGAAHERIAAKSDLFERVKAGSPVEFQMRTLDDVTAADQDAMVPAYVGDMSDVLSNERPFLSTTREIPVPDEGTAIQLPKITQHTEVGVQSAEKTEVASRPLKTDLDTFNMITIAGAVDVSLQFLKRAPAAVRNLLFDDMAAEYAAKAEAEALDALLDQAAVHEGGTLDAEDVSLGAAFINAYTELRRAPDTIWLSTAALGSFIDAKNDNTNTPLYGSVQANATAAGGVTGTISGLRVVHVPALSDTAVDVLVGPSRGFIWAEDGTYRLEVDNVALAGRDIGIVGFMFLMPRYPAAFTSYTLGS